MSVELLQTAVEAQIFREALDFGQHGVSQAKGVLAGAGSAALLGLGVYARMKSASGQQDGIASEGRVKFVDQGYIGLRERNRQFYKSIPLYDIMDPQSQIIGYDREYYETLLPGLRLAVVPWRKYKLLNTQSQTMPFKFENTQIENKAGRLHNIAGNFTWGHITGVDGDRQRVEYAFLNDSEKHAAGPVSVEQLIFNGIIAAKHQAELGEQVRSILEPVVADHLQGSKNPVKKALNLFTSVEMAVHDDLLDLGSELRQVKPVVSPHIFGHFAMKNGDGHIGQDRQLELAAVAQIGLSHPGVGFGPAAIIRT